MGKYLILIILVVIVSCKKKTNPVTPGNPTNTPTSVTPTTARFIPNWRTDTLVAYFVDIQGNVIYDTATSEPVYDTLLTYTVNDTSFIEHSKIRYYLWWEPYSGLDSFENNAQSYYSCVISTARDTTGVIASGVGVRPYRNWDNFYNDWKYTRQDLWGYNFNKKYKISPLEYQSIRE